eukprot:gene19701-27027_t
MSRHGTARHAARRDTMHSQGLIDQIPGRGRWLEGDAWGKLRDDPCAITSDGGQYRILARNKLDSTGLELCRLCRVALFLRPFSFMGAEYQVGRGAAVPAAWIRDSAGAKLRAHFPPDGVPSVSVHQRHHAWGDKEKFGSKYLCRADRGHASRNIWTSHRKEMLAITQLSCALDWGDLKQIMHEEPASLAELKRNGAVTLSESDVPTDRWHCPSNSGMVRHAAVLFDLWGMSRGKYFIGSFYSTMSESVCWVRGKHRRDESQFCFLPDRLREDAAGAVGAAGG